MRSSRILKNLVIAHRGASSKAPENTVAAFRKAAELGAQWVEFDVMLSKDNVAVVFHDDELGRTTNGSGRLCDQPYSALAQLDAGSWFGSQFKGERIPKFTDVIDVLKQGNMAANVEIKVPEEVDEAYQQRLVQTIVNEINANWLPGMPRPLLSSFSMFALRYARKLAPDADMAALVHTNEDFAEAKQTAEELGCVSMNLNHEMTTADKVQMINEMGKAVICYTVDTQQEADRLFSMGVDGIFTNRIDEIHASPRLRL